MKSTGGGAVVTEMAEPASLITVISVAEAALVTAATAVPIVMAAFRLAVVEACAATMAASLIAVVSAPDALA